LEREICWYGDNCRFEEFFGKQCIYTHSQDLELNICLPCQESNETSDQNFIQDISRLNSEPNTEIQLCNIDDSNDSNRLISSPDLTSIILVIMNQKMKMYANIGKKVNVLIMHIMEKNVNLTIQKF